jgi:hypothetical protein
MPGHKNRTGRVLNLKPYFRTKPEYIHRRAAEDTENSTFSLAGDTAKEKPTYRLAKIKSRVPQADKFLKSVSPDFKKSLCALRLGGENNFLELRAFS